MSIKVSKNRLTLILVLILSTTVGALASQLAISNTAVKSRLLIVLEKFLSPVWFAQQTGASVDLLIFAFLFLIFSFFFVYGKTAVVYAFRIFRTFIHKDAHTHHFLIGSILPFSFSFVRLHVLVDCYKWSLFKGDVLVCAILAGLCGVFVSFLFKEDNEKDSNENEADLYDRKDMAEYLERRIRNTFEAHSRKLPRTLAVVGGRGSGKTFLIKMLCNILSEKNKLLPEDKKIAVKVFKPWDYDNYNDFYKEVVEFVIEQIELQYVIPSKKKIVDILLKSDIGKPKELVTDTMGLFKVSDEENKISLVKKWIDAAGWLLLIFDDLDRCYQSEVRAVLRLIERFEGYSNVFILASTDKETLEKVDKFKNRIEVATKVSQ